MSGFKVNFSVNNQLATPAIHAAALANRPAFGQPGRVFIDTDNPSTGIYRDTGTAWIQVAATSSPEADTLQTVTDRGNTTTQDIAIGTSSTPSAPLDVHGSDTIAILQGTGTNNAFLQFNKSGNGKFKTGNVHNGGNDYFTVYNMQENADAILVNISTNNVAIGGGVVAPSYRLDVQGSFRSTGEAYLASSGGNVGIGITSPASKLTLNQTATGEQKISFTLNGSEYGYFAVNTTTGRVNLGSNSYSTRYFGTSHFFNNTVNIDSASATGNSPSLNFSLSGSQSYSSIYVNWSSPSLNIEGSSNAAYSTRFSTGGSERMRIFGNGNIAIGSNTDTGYKCQINGSLAIGNASPIAGWGFYNPSTSRQEGTALFVGGIQANQWSNGGGAMTVVLNTTAGRTLTFQDAGATLGNSDFINVFSGYNITNTGTGTTNIFKINPNAGNISTGGVFNFHIINPVINQSSGTGTIYGYRFNPTNTAVLSKVYAFHSSSGNVNFSGLPTSSAGLATGDLWNDSGTLKIA